MNNNDILRRLRYAYDFSDKRTAELCSLDPASTEAISATDVRSLLAKEEAAEFKPCSDSQLAAFLDGLIVDRRGLREPAPPVKPLPADFRLSKNDILKKLRIAMNFREEDMLNTLAAGGTQLSKSELGALFRKPQHKHYRSCGNQVLRNFIKGLTLSLRPEG